MSEETTYIISGLSATESDALFARFMSGEADEREQLLLAAWQAENTDHARYLNDLRQIWNTTPASQPVLEVDTDAAWKRMQARMHVQPPAAQEPVVRSLAQRFSITRVAASVAVLAGIAALLYFTLRSDELPQQRSLAATDKPVESRLQDGSQVHLNNGSRLDYPETFAGNTREVTLSGEAFFQVQRNPKKPFIIHAGPLDVRVLGTSFNVKAYPGREDVLVSVETGKVRCATEADSIELVAGEEAIYNLRTKRFERRIMDTPNAFGFRSRMLVFKKTPMAQVISDLNDTYHTSIIVRNQQLLNCPVDARFRNNKLEEVLDILNMQYGITAEKRGDTIIIDGKPWN